LNKQAHRLTATAAWLLLTWQQGGYCAAVLQAATAYLLALGDSAAMCGLPLTDIGTSTLAATDAQLRYHCLLVIQSGAAAARVLADEDDLDEEDLADVQQAITSQHQVLEMLVLGYGVTIASGSLRRTLTASRMSLNLAGSGSKHGQPSNPLCHCSRSTLRMSVWRQPSCGRWRAARR